MTNRRIGPALEERTLPPDHLPIRKLSCFIPARWASMSGGRDACADVCAIRHIDSGRAEKFPSCLRRPHYGVALWSRLGMAFGPGCWMPLRSSVLVSGRGGPERWVRRTHRHQRVEPDGPCCSGPLRKIRSENSSREPKRHSIRNCCDHP